MKRSVNLTAGFIIAALALAGALAGGVGPVAAHHSGSMFDRTKVITIKGVVVELRWVNPHVSLSVNGAANEGEPPALWVMEMTSPGNLVRAGGWRRDAVKPGDRVEITFNPLREIDHRGGSLIKMVALDSGEVFTANLRDQERPGLE